MKLKSLAIRSRIVRIDCNLCNDALVLEELSDHVYFYIQVPNDNNFSQVVQGVGTTINR